MICLLSALVYHEITTQAPYQVWMAIEEKAWTPKIEHVPIRFVRFSETLLKDCMSAETIKNMAASVHQRLLNISRERKYDFNRICIRYAAERLLYRLSVSGHADQFILKGAMLFAIWSLSPHRITRDVDLLKKWFT